MAELPTSSVAAEAPLPAVPPIGHAADAHWLDFLRDVTACGQWEWDETAKALCCNPQAVAFRGNAPTSIAQFLAQVDSVDRPAVQAALAQAIAHGSTSTVTYHLEALDGTRTEVRGSIRGIDVPGRGRMVLGVEQAGQAPGLAADHDARIAHLGEDVARAHAEKDKFVYICSHDLREPVRMITGFLSLLQRRLPPLDERQAEYFAFVMSGAKRIDDLLDDLLTYSRCGSGRKPAILAVPDAVRDATHFLEGSIAEAKAVIEISPELPELVADRAQLVTLFHHLIDNALKFRSSMPLVVTIRARRQDQEWVFTVADNGIGIADDDCARVFDMFQRLHSREDFAGNGLGLALCKRIVEQHGGTISIAGRPAAGATVTFTLPA